MKYVLSCTLVFALVACDSKSDKPNVELIQNMMESPAIKAQDYDPSKKDYQAMRMPPEGTVAQGKAPYMYKAQPEKAGKELVNPFSGNEQVLEKGKLLYDTYCMVCHGPKGLGNGTVADKMLVKPPVMNSEKVVSWSDGRIYHVITDGQGLMGSYASQISKEDRWKIVNYVRQLQKETKQ
tara:strand:+ start:7110 stop:7649 length:540 start_codon:yes stop_codon:yes gene_type:complete